MSKRSPGLIALLQATLITLYCMSVGLLMWRADEIFGKVNTFLGPVLFLVLFVVSAVACSLIYFWYPFKTFWENKKEITYPIKIVIYTTLWLLAGTGLIVLILIS